MFTRYNYRVKQYQGKFNRKYEEQTYAGENGKYTYIYLQDVSNSSNMIYLHESDCDTPIVQSMHYSAPNCQMF